MSLIPVLQPYAKLIYTSLGIILDVSTFLKFSHVYYCDICVHQAAKGRGDSHDGLIELFESIEHFLKRIDIYTKVPSTPALDEMVIKILMELLSTLASATKELKQGQPSKSVLTEVLRYSMQCRDICKKIIWRKGR